MKICPPEYWVWLQTALGYGARTDEILSFFETPEDLYTAGSNEWRLSGLFTEKKIQALKSISPSQTSPVFNECRKMGYNIITPDSILYPDRLRTLSDMPLVLYGLGDCSVLSDNLSIGIVGTRKASRYGIEIAQKLSYRLAESGATIVSGGALGVDSEAHAGAMLAKGRTMAFLGCGLSYDYLKENAPLRRAITRHGAIFSEYQPFTPPSRATFPIRNRLISGSCLGVVVIEAGIKSGSLITANCALEQGRDVFAVPGDILKSSFDGTGFLIKNGAKSIFSAEDVLCEYEYLYGDFMDLEKASKPLSAVPYVEYRKKKSTVPKAVRRENENAEIKTTEASRERAQAIEKRALGDEASKEAKIIYEVLNTDETHIDDIVRKTNLKMNAVLSSLTELEILGYIQQTNGKKYKVI